MRFGVLGPLAVWTEDGEPVRIPEAKIRALLADLLIQEGRPVSADRLIDDLWDGDLPRHPANALQQKVSQLRRVLNDAEPGARDLVGYGPAGYRLTIEADAVDGGRFAVLVSRAGRTTDPRARSALLADALALWRGPALADFTDAAFVAPAIARLEEARLAALEERAETRLELGEHRALVGELGDLAARHPLRERMQAAYLRALYGAGRQAEALEAYEQVRRRLADELGADPGPPLAALHASMLRQDPALTPQTVRLTRPDLPAQVTTLVGREEEVHRVRAALERSRLVTLTGTGGVGKTRLALEVAATWSEDDGVILAELAELRRFDEDVVLDALGIRDDGRRPLHEVLYGRRLLLVLDNCEHLLDQVAAVVGPLLRGVPGLRVLATSREPLRLSGEAVIVVSPLAHGDAVRLFTERAGEAVDDDEAVATICRRLGGIPLALELAASRVRGLGVRELRDRLGLRLLGDGPRDAPARQRTLAAVIDWSWELLGQAERAVLARLAVHAGGCTLEAAERTCAGGGVGVCDVMDILARLVDRSMLVQGDGRYRLLEPIAEYCAERLSDAGELETMRERHRDYYTALAVQAGAQLRGHDQHAWITRLEAESANLRAALDHARGHGAADCALRLVNGQAWYWFMTGRLGEARRSIAAALSVPGSSPGARAEALAWHAGIGICAGEAGNPELALDAVADPATRARLRWFVGFAQIGVGAQADGVGHLNEALREFEAMADRWGTAAVLAGLARYAAMRSDFAAARRNGERAAELFAELGDQWGLLQTAEPLGVPAEAGGAYAEATRHFATGLRVAEQLGLWSEVSLMSARLGRIALLTGDPERADELHERARRLAVEQSNKSMEEFARIGLGLAARRRGDLDEAERYFRTGLEWMGRIGGVGPRALLLAELGFVAEQRGDARTASELHAHSLEAARADGDARAEALALEGLAGARLLQGEPGEAVRLLRTARVLRERTNAPLPEAERFDVDRITAALRENYRQG
ncbi:AfsR/SARP family transcriptional regulator [Nonomuraea turkmeniaca]|uniref:AfsR/SARP family transcriptional regulator n=1 Tax=Nonomuraea turkmeniaca TaxID=103838 RepID=A0A5S4FLI7_9ACTN|nr:BTAD domain-containing putative transcriptional regulator [Nonomuraea turkmeniaca]TMR21513.1 AfsR/SARP family transcriptional regulator [Nonomuraea turkmeniaca]